MNPAHGQSQQCTEFNTGSSTDVICKHISVHSPGMRVIDHQIFSFPLECNVSSTLEQDFTVVVLIGVVITFTVFFKSWNSHRVS